MQDHPQKHLLPGWVSLVELWFFLVLAIAACRTSQAATASELFVFAETLRESTVSAHNSILLRRRIIGIVDVNVH
jgi:hypothetical protein